LKKTALIILLLFSANVTIYAETIVKGGIEKNESWIPKLSPYIIENTITVEKNGFLTIYPGTEVKFKEGAKLVVKGALYAKGDPKNPVRFLPYDGESFYDGIIFQSRYKNTIEFCIMIRGAITSEGTPLIMSNNYILNSTGVLLKVYADALITGNYFYNNTYGVYTEGKNAKFRISGNTFNRNRFAVYLKEMMKDGAQITGNNFFENKVSITNYTPDAVSAKDNFWGAVEEAGIGRQIFDKKNNSKVGDVIYKPFAKAKLKVYEPPDPFISLVKIYLSLKRPDEEPARVSFGAGANGLYILSPVWLNNEFDMGYGMRAEFTYNITGAFKAGVEAELLAGTGTNSLYDFNFSLTQFIATFYGYMGYKKNIFFVPYVKAGMGVGLISAEWKSKTGLPLPELGGKPSNKYNGINYSVFGGLGAELFITRYMSVKAEALYNCTTDKNGAIMFPLLNITGCFYFDTPIYLNQK
jgi:opacity protein-like surface antigen